MDSLIGADQPLGVAAGVAAILALAVLAEHTRVGRLLSAPAMILIAGMACSNLGLLPFSAPLYGGIVVYLVPAAIPLLLFRADLRRIVRETGTMLPSYAMGTVFVVIGTFVGVLLVDLGAEESKLAGTLAATFIGGSMNFVAVSTALQFEDPSLVAAALASDNVIGATYLVLLSVATGTAAFLRHTRVPAGTAAASAPADDAQGDRALPLLTGMSGALALSIAIVFVSTWLAGALGLGDYTIFLVTVIAVALANLFPGHLRRLTGDFELGTLFMYAFFVVIGLSTQLQVFFANALSVALFATIIIGLHVALLFAAARALRLDFAETAIVSNALIAGPATAVALAASRGWQHLVTPGLLLGVLGYVIGNFIGVTIAKVLGG